MADACDDACDDGLDPLDKPTTMSALTAACINACHALLLTPALLVDVINPFSLRRPPRVAVDDVGESQAYEERHPPRAKSLKGDGGESDVARDG